MNSYPTPELQRPFKDNKVKVTFPWMYAQRDDKFMFRNKNPGININFIFCFSFSFFNLFS